MMPASPNFIIDASVALKWFIEEDRSSEALSLYSYDLAAPSLIRIEVANVLRMLVAKGRIEEHEAAKHFEIFQTAPVTIFEVDDELERHALDIALEIGQTVFDCLYLALALRTDTTLVTADKRFLRAVNSSRYDHATLSLKDVRTTASGMHRRTRNAA